MSFNKVSWGIVFMNKNSREILVVVESVVRKVLCNRKVMIFDDMRGNRLNGGVGCRRR